jgi:hypothetical protein
MRRSRAVTWLTSVVTLAAGAPAADNSSPERGADIAAAASVITLLVPKHEVAYWNGLRGCGLDKGVCQRSAGSFLLYVARSAWP